MLFFSTRTLIEDIQAFHKECEEELSKNNELDEKKFKIIESSLITLQDHLSKIDFKPTSLMFDEKFQRLYLR